jgi:hypothetical protein
MKLTPVWVAALVILTISSVVTAVILVRMEFRTVAARKAVEAEHRRQVEANRRQVEADRARVMAQLEAFKREEKVEEARKAKFDTEIQAILKKDAAIRQARWDAEAAAAAASTQAATQRK